MGGDEMASGGEEEGEKKDEGMEEAAPCPSPA